MSTAIAGPSSPSANATRPIAVLKEVPVTVYRLAAGSAVSFASRIRLRYSLLLIPAYTPVRLPASRSGSIPASSSARQLVSSIRRCCGSSICASTGEIRKKGASNSSRVSR